MLTLFCILCVFAFVLYKFLSANFAYWEKLDVPNPPVSLFFGNLQSAVSMKKSLGQVYTDIYNTYKHLPYVGIFKVRQPGLLIRDPDIIRNILVRDFSCFQNNDVHVDEKVDPIAGKNPFFLHGRRWKETRSQLSSGFTSGKMKAMIPHMIVVAKRLISYLEKESISTDDGIETKELAAKFTTDNVASCAFGLQGRSFDDPKAEFREFGRKIFQSSLFMNLKTTCIFLFPSLTKLIKIQFIPEDAATYFRNIVTSTLKFRRENNVTRNDFLDVMNQLKDKSTEYGFTDEHVTAQAVSFFADGVETSSITLSFALYDLATNNDIQEKLKEEIDAILEKYEGNITYEAIQQMTLLDCVLSESLRLHPPALFLTKLCNDDYPIPSIKDNGKNTIVEVGTTIIIPIYGLHYDENYYPNPQNFLPDRFSEKSKVNIIKGTYLPFGDGPRMCLGQRFALLQVKVAVVAIIKDFQVRVNKKTIIPIEVDPKYFMMAAKGGLWLDYYRRV